jgi:hypothetical protein
MTTIRAIKSREDGGIDITIPSPQYIQQLMMEKNISESEAVVLIFQKDAPDADIIDVKDIPTDRRYRNDWCIKNRKINIDMVKAKSHFLEMLRKQRNKELDDTDAIILRAQEQNKNNEVQEFKTKRQSLRDLPQTIQPILDQATTVDDLDNIFNSFGYGISPNGEEPT